MYAVLPSLLAVFSIKKSSFSRGGLKATQVTQSSVFGLLLKISPYGLKIVIFGNSIFSSSFLFLFPNSELMIKLCNSHNYFIILCLYELKNNESNLEITFCTDSDANFNLVTKLFQRSVYE